MDQTKSIELQKKRLEMWKLGLQVHVHKPLIIMYDKGGTVEVYGEFLKLIGLFCLLLHVSIIFQGWAHTFDVRATI